MLKNAHMQDSSFDKLRINSILRKGERRSAFPTVLRGNKPAPCLTRGRMRVASRRIRSDFLPRRRDGEAAGESREARDRWAFFSIL
jgi:hypothetical protein